MAAMNEMFVFILFCI